MNRDLKICLTFTVVCRGRMDDFFHFSIVQVHFVFCQLNFIVFFFIVLLRNSCVKFFSKMRNKSNIIHDNFSTCPITEQLIYLNG